MGTMTDIFYPYINIYRNSGRLINTISKVFILIVGLFSSFLTLFPLFFSSPYLFLLTSFPYFLSYTLFFKKTEVNIHYF